MRTFRLDIPKGIAHVERKRIVEKVARANRWWNQLILQLDRMKNDESIPHQLRK